MFRYRKYGKEYRKDLIRSPCLWMGVILIILSFVLYFFKIIGSTIFIALFAIGFILMIATKYRILRKIEDRHKK